MIIWFNISYLKYIMSSVRTLLMFHIMIFLNNMISFLIRLFSIKLLERIIFFRSQTKKTIAKSKRTFTELYTTMKKIVWIDPTD
jgi:hypothetical protein